jgi:succinyl-diaminopimelate desuccinylase
MHQVDERVAVADLDGLAAIYRKVLGAYFSRSSTNPSAPVFD